jgi:hypothetical protein
MVRDTNTAASQPFRLMSSEIKLRAVESPGSGAGSHRKPTALAVPGNESPTVVRSSHRGSEIYCAGAYIEDIPGSRSMTS